MRAVSFRHFDIRSLYGHFFSPKSQWCVILKILYHIFFVHNKFRLKILTYSEIFKINRISNMLFSSVILVTLYKHHC